RLGAFPLAFRIDGKVLFRRVEVSKERIFAHHGELRASADLPEAEAVESMNDTGKTLGLGARIEPPYMETINIRIRLPYVTFDIFESFIGALHVHHIGGVGTVVAIPSPFCPRLDA